MIDPTEVRARLDAVIAAMKSAGSWDVQRPDDQAFNDMGAFGMRSMAFEQWLRWVFVPNVEGLLATNGPWPSRSEVAVQAVREGDTSPEIAALVPALHDFDALFTRDPEPEDEAGGEVADEVEDEAEAEVEDGGAAQVAYEASRSAFQSGDHARALASIRAALEAEPDFPNAENFAGWVLLRSPSRTPAELDEAIAHFRAAVEAAPADPVPLANLCEALVEAGREADAVAEAQRATASEHAERRAAGHNWLGYRMTGRPDTHGEALVHLERAVALHPTWGVARVNLANALEIAHRSDEAYEEHARALDCDGDFDRAFCHERRAAHEARQGWLRNALSSFRAAQREDRRSGNHREATYAEAVAWLTGQLRARGIEAVAPGRELVDASWLRACELEQPPGFGCRDESGRPLSEEVIEVERLIRAERFADAVTQLELLKTRDTGKLFDAAGFAERGAELAASAGHRTQAADLMRLVVDAYLAWASWATSGAEGLGRMATVEEKRERLRAWEPGSRPHGGGRR